MLGKETFIFKDILISNQLEFPGVYVCTSQDDSEFKYVGRTGRDKNGNLRTIKQRIYNHRHSGTTGDLFAKTGPECMDYKVRAVKIEDDRERMLFEKFVISILNPQYSKD